VDDCKYQQWLQVGLFFDSLGFEDAIGSVGVAEVGALYNNDAAPRRYDPARLGDPGRTLRKDPRQAVLRWRRRVDRWDGPAASRGLARMLHFPRHYPPVARVAKGLLSRLEEKRRTQSSSPLVVSVLMNSSNSSGSVGQSPRSSRRSLLMALTQSRPAIGLSL